LLSNVRFYGEICNTAVYHLRVYNPSDEWLIRLVKKTKTQNLQLSIFTLVITCYNYFHGKLKTHAKLASSNNRL